jgi:hypothetical protein
MVALIFNCNCETCDGGTPAGKDAQGNQMYGGTHCICSCHHREESVSTKHEHCPCKAELVAAVIALEAEIAELKAQNKTLEAADFWKDIVVKDGELDVAQVKLELEDYNFMMKQVPIVYDNVTGGLLSKLMYEAETVVGAFNDYLQRERDEAFEEGKRAAKEEPDTDITFDQHTEPPKP